MKKHLTGNRIKNINLRNRSKKLQERKELEEEQRKLKEQNKCPSRADNNKIYRDWIKKARTLPKYEGLTYHEFLKASREDYYQYKNALEE